jgi:formate hydrogenlyase subunit 6/NADH:ubiquinone oxidoreductase subunit I
MHSGWAEIDESRCSECYTCVEVCPQGAITEQASISHKELRTTVASLKEKTEGLLKRIEKIKQSWHNFGDVTNKEPI